MDYALENIGTVHACDTLLALVWKKKENLEHRRRNLGESIPRFNERIDTISNELASVHMWLETFAAASRLLTEGSKHRVEMNIKIKRLEVRKARLDKMSVTYNIHSLIKKQVDYNRLESQVSAIDACIAAVHHKRTQLNNTISLYLAEPKPLARRPLVKWQSSPDRKKEVIATSSSTPVVSCENPQSTKIIFIYLASSKVRYTFYKYMLLLVFILCSCTPGTKENANASTGTLRHNAQDSTKSISSSPASNEPQQASIADTLLFAEDSLFVLLDPVPTEISKNDFERYNNNYKRACATTPDGFIKGTGLSITSDCDEICEEYLMEDGGGRKLLLPSGYDQGIIDLTVSPACHQFIVYSSYDGPDYESYYDHRAEVIGFSITDGKGLNAIKPRFKYYTKDWSIESVVWINENSIALKVYEEARAGDGISLHYKYLALQLE